MWIFFDFPLLFVLQEFISGYVLFVFNFQIKYLKNLALASILFCNRELFTEFPIPGPAHSPPPLLHCFTSEGSAWEKSGTRGRVLPEGSPPPAVQSPVPPLGSKTHRILNLKVSNQSSGLEGARGK